MHRAVLSAADMPRKVGQLDQQQVREGGTSWLRGSMGRRCAAPGGGVFGREQS